MNTFEGSSSHGVHLSLPAYDNVVRDNTILDPVASGIQIGPQYEHPVSTDHSSPASSQKAFEIEEGASSWDFSYRWKDADNKAKKVAFSLPSGSIQADWDEVTWLQRKVMNTAVAKEIRAWGKKLKGVSVKVKVEKGGVTTSVSGERSKARAALK
jgi:hypothetical protein